MLYVADGLFKYYSRYESKEEAEEKAEYLARVYEGSKVYLLEAIGCCMVSEQPVSWDR